MWKWYVTCLEIVFTGSSFGDFFWHSFLRRLSCGRTEPPRDEHMEVSQRCKGQASSWFFSVEHCVCIV